MALVDHLGELRRRVAVILIALGLTGIVAFWMYPFTLRFLQAPYCKVQHPCQLFVTGPLDGLSLRIKVTAYSALALASPVILWQLWRFLAPGMTRAEKRTTLPFVLSSLVMFAAGGALAFESFPHALAFLGSIGGPSIRHLYSPSSYLGLILAVVVVFGVTFELPVVLVALQMAGVLTPRSLAAHRRLALIAIVLVAAIITPSGDPFSMIALSIPLYAFYETSILIGKVTTKRTRSTERARELV